MTHLFRYVVAVALLSLVGAASPPTADLSSRLHIRHCSVGTSKAQAMCGTLTVPEDRSSATGRTIAIHFILIKAKHPSQRALVFNPGGPGGAATDDAEGFAADDGPFGKLRDGYDMLLVDNRGTGGSAPQPCDFAPPAHPELYFLQGWPDALVKACRDRLAAHANLSLYSTTVAAADLDEVRAALGYPKLALFGGSYGTRFYLAYARQYPTHVESIVLDGVAPPHYYILPLPMAAGAQTSIDNLIAACSADASCSQHFPAFKAQFNDLVHRFDAGPIDVPVRNAVTHRMQTVQLSKEVFVETIRHALYFPTDAGNLPVIVARASRGNYVALASLVDEMAQFFANSQETGLNLSVTCAEDIPFIQEADISRMSADTFEGDARVRAQQRACGIWDVQPVSPSFIDPVKSDLPILMISGSDDPASPPSYAKAALQDLPNARMMLVKGASHDGDFPPCVFETMVSFIQAQSAAGLDLASCAAKYQRPSFATLTYFESAPGENVAITARARAIFVGFAAGRIDRAPLTAAVSRQYTETVLKQGASDLAGLGAMESFVYRSAKQTAKGTAYAYFVHCAQGNVTFTMTLNAKGKISDLDISG